MGGGLSYLNAIAYKSGNMLLIVPYACGLVVWLVLLIYMSLPNCAKKLQQITSYITGIW